MDKSKSKSFIGDPPNLALHYGPGFLVIWLSQQVAALSALLYAIGAAGQLRPVS